MEHPEIKIQSLPRFEGGVWHFKMLGLKVQLRAGRVLVLTDDRRFCAIETLPPSSLMKQEAEGERLAKHTTQHNTTKNHVMPATRNKCQP